jgi:ribonuclease D
MTPILIESSGAMDALISELENEKIIAVDTEFFRETTYYPQLALVQIATDSIVACIDPLAFDAKPALQKILLDKNLIKIFHSCSQDMEVLFYYLGEAPTAIYDTQIANALLTEHQQIGYASLVENELGVQLDKSQTRTNWLQRPLTAAQIHYAGDDVFYLYQLQQVLDEKLDDLGRKAWFDEENLNLQTDENSFQVAIDKLWQRVRGSSRLNRKQLAIVQSIAHWREKFAQELDKTRRKALADDVVIQIALNPPANIEALNSFLARNYNITQLHKQQLFDAIETALELPEESWPQNRFNSLDNEQKALLKTLQQLVNNKAEELNISSAMLYTKKDLEKLIVRDTDKPQTQDQFQSEELINRESWRYLCIGKDLLETVEKIK